MNKNEAIKLLNDRLEQIKKFCNKNKEYYVEDLPTYMFLDKECRKAIETLINEYNNLKQIEEAHRIENGKLRERIKQLEEIDKHIPHID